MDPLPPASNGPFSADDAFCHLLGIELLKDEPGEAIASLVVEPRHLNAIGVLHGGALFSFADATLARASYRLGEPAVVISAQAHFLRGALVGDRLVAHATEDFRGGRLGSYRVEIRRHGDQELIATAVGQSFRLSTHAEK
jgi:acyl-CoA thioesterase